MVGARTTEYRISKVLFSAAQGLSDYSSFIQNARIFKLQDYENTYQT
jgi:hypothetical protein